MRKTITVITLSYNSDDVIYETIDSILMQDYPSIELIIADDCSKTFNVSEIKKYIEKHKSKNIVSIKIIKNKINLGTVKNINNAIKTSQGEIIVNLSAGDLFYSEKTLSLIHKEFEEKKCDILCTRRAYFKENTEKVEKLIPDDFEIIMIKKIDTALKQMRAIYSGNMYNFASGCAFCYTRKIMYMLNYFDETYRLWEDGPFFAKYSEKIGMIHTNYDIISIYYRYGGVSTTGMSPGIKRDAQLFLTNGLKNIGNDWFTKRQINYRLFYIKSLNKFSKKKYLQRIFLFPDVLMYKFVNRIKKIIFEKGAKVCK